MKLALVTETFPPEVNGVSMTLGRLVKGLSERGFQVQVVRPSQGAENESHESGNEGVSEIVVSSIPLPGYDGLRMGQPSAYRLLRDWSSSPPDIVHVATEGPLGQTALWVANRLGIPASSTYHTNFHQYTGHYHIGLIRDFILVFLRITHNSCGCTLAPTRQMANELKSLGFKNTGVLSRGVDTELFAPERRDPSLRTEWGVGEEDRVFVYVGRVAREKNIDLAVEAFQKARNHSGRSVMVVVGDGPERGRLEAKFPDVIFSGMRKGIDLARHYASSDVFLFPSLTETFGNVVTEALSSGLAIVAYDYAASRELIENGRNGYIVPFKDPDKFHRMATVAMELGVEDLNELKTAARLTALSISWDRVVDAFEGSLEIVRKRYREGHGKAI